jgi:hypothetical protein
MALSCLPPPARCKGLFPPATPPSPSRFVALPHYLAKNLSQMRTWPTQMRAWLTQKGQYLAQMRTWRTQIRACLTQKVNTWPGDARVWLRSVSLPPRTIRIRLKRLIPESATHVPDSGFCSNSPFFPYLQLGTREIWSQHQGYNDAKLQDLQKRSSTPPR